MNNSSIDKWRALRGDETLALAWDLNEDSHVWEIGGYEGRWAQQIWDKFHCNITIFEPQEWAVDKMRERFKGIEKIEIRPYGLWTHSGTKMLGSYFTDGASVFGSKPPVAYENYFANLITEVYDFPDQIDLCLMNVEGAEYYLIPELTTTTLMKRFDYFWCQFHPQFSNLPVQPDPDEGIQMDWHIYDMMKKTHDLLWDCYPTAVAWKRRA